MVQRRLLTIVVFTVMATAVVILLGDVRLPTPTRSTVQIGTSFPLPLSDALEAATTAESNDDDTVECGVDRDAWALPVPPARPTHRGAPTARRRPQSTVLRI